MIRALRRDAPLSRLAPGALLYLLHCGIARGPSVDSESHFLACSTETDCAGAAGATCANGWCVDVGTGERIQPGALDGVTGDALPSGSNEPAGGPLLNPDAIEAPQDLPLASSNSISVDDPCFIRTQAVPLADQAALDRFEGCESIYGDLDLGFAADLRPLHALRNLFGNLSIHPVLQLQSSLEGLENLELVSGGLHLMRLSVASLANLAALRSVGAALEGAVWIEDSAGLRDLSGLESLTDLNDLNLSGLPDLVSIDALQLPRRLGSIVLQDVPSLTSAEALRAVSLLDTLILQNTALERLDMLSAGARIRSLTIADNALLTDATGIHALEELEVRGNARLVTLAPSAPNGFQRLAVHANPSLQSITGLDQLAYLESISVSENPALTVLSFPGLQTLIDLEVLRNPGLTAIQLPLLIDPLQRLVVVSNPSLEPDSLFSFAARAQKTKLAGNQGDSIGLDPCPFQRDNYCDAAPVDALCAPGTDAFDCRE